MVDRNRNIVELDFSSQVGPLRGVKCKIRMPQASAHVAMTNPATSRTTATRNQISQTTARPRFHLAGPIINTDARCLSSWRCDRYRVPVNGRQLFSQGIKLSSVN
jgi:hypothetical protein